MNYVLFVLLALTGSSTLTAQDCSCTTEFNWLRKTFRENDAGFDYHLRQKGKEAFASHNAEFTEQLNRLEATPTAQPDDCLQLMRNWLAFFRPGHIGAFTARRSVDRRGRPQGSDEEIRQQFVSWERRTTKPAALKKRLTDSFTDNLEGIWSFGPYRIGVQREADEYVGFIIDGDGVYWLPEQVKFRIAANGKTGTYYMRDHSAREMSVQLLGRNYLEFDNGYLSLTRNFPNLSRDEAIDRYVQGTSTNDPTFLQLDEQTAYLRIPDFSHELKGIIDSTITANRAAIVRTPDLIIDLRGNTGGSDVSYEQLIPLIYTNPIRTIGMHFLSTELNNQRILQMLDYPELSPGDTAEVMTFYDQMNAQLGEFVRVGDSIAWENHPEVLPYPARVGILIDQDNASTTEQFLLAAKQSRKVKLYGVTTFGALDVSNMHVQYSPCGTYGLSYCLSLSDRINGMAIDGIGLQPDYYVDQSIQPWEWVEFVRRSWGTFKD